MKKTTLIIALIIIIGLAGLFALRLLSPEDSWICVNNEWVKHGNPSQEKPDQNCGEKNRPNVDMATDCQENQGVWLEEYKECESIGQDWCDRMGGKFNECGSACRHNPDAEICTLQCVPFCSFNINGGEMTDKNDDAIKESDAKADLIIVDEPAIDATISSPFYFSGKARGTWFFEASFPVILTDWDGKIIGQAIATAKDDWMTENFVAFDGQIEFNYQGENNRGYLIFKKDNPSGLPEYDDALEIPIYLK